MTSLNQLTSSTKSDLCNVVHVDLSNEDDTTVSEPPPKKQLLESNASDPSHHNNSSNNLVSSVGSSLRASPFAEEFKDPAVLSRIQERIKTHLQITVTQSINSVLHDVTVAVDRVNQLKKNTEDLQKRLVHLETVSRKVERLVNESVWFFFNFMLIYTSRSYCIVSKIIFIPPSNFKPHNTAIALILFVYGVCVM